MFTWVRGATVLDSTQLWHSYRAGTSGHRRARDIDFVSANSLNIPVNLLARIVADGCGIKSERCRAIEVQRRNERGIFVQRLSAVANGGVAEPRGAAHSSAIGLNVALPPRPGARWHRRRPA
jgi:hypothetical protein